MEAIGIRLARGAPLAVVSRHTAASLCGLLAIFALVNVNAQGAEEALQGGPLLAELWDATDCESLHADVKRVCGHTMVAKSSALCARTANDYTSKCRDMDTFVPLPKMEDTVSLLELGQGVKFSGKDGDYPPINLEFPTAPGQLQDRRPSQSGHQICPPCCEVLTHFFVSQRVLIQMIRNGPCCTLTVSPTVKTTVINCRLVDKLVVSCVKKSFV